MSRDQHAAGLEPLHVIVPLRTIAGGKARLGEVLDAEEREALVLGMLRRTLDIVSRWPAADAVHIVSPDPDLDAALGAQRGAGATILRQVGDGLNAGLCQGREAATAAGARAVLILPADLPALETAALDRLLDAADAALAAGSGRPVVVIAPSDARGGTNALLLAPADVIEPSFGQASFEAHVRAAAAADASLQVVTDHGLGFDLDTPEDLEVLSPDTLSELMRLGQEAPTMGARGR